MRSYSILFSFMLILLSGFVRTGSPKGEIVRVYFFFFDNLNNYPFLVRISFAFKQNGFKFLMFLLLATD